MDRYQTSPNKPYSLANVIEAFPDFQSEHSCGGPTSPTSHIADASGFNVRTINRYAKFGLDEFQADVLAIRLGTHPALIWETWLEDGR